MSKTAEELLADYISSYVHWGKPHELKSHALRDYRAGKPFTAQLKYMHRRIVEMIGEHETNALIASAFKTMKLLNPEPEIKWHTGIATRNPNIQQIKGFSSNFFVIDEASSIKRLKP